MIALALSALAAWMATAALVVAAMAHRREDEHEARLDALERDDDGLDTLPPEVDPPRAPIGFRRE